MTAYDWNKIIGAVLGTLLFVMGIGFVAEAIYAPKEGVGGGYALPAPDGNADTAQTAAPAIEATPLPVLLASASAEAGAKAAKKCAACHDFSPANANKTGPGLWNIVDRPIAEHPEFSYSDALKQLAAEDGKWTYQHLFDFIHSPKKFAPGTKMGFAGIKSDKERADLLAYLATLSDNPVPFPAPTADSAATPAADNAAPAAAASH